MTKKVLAVYDRTLRRVSLIHTLTRAMVWNLGELGVKTLSKITRFDLPNERLLPLFRLPMLLGTYEMDTVRTCKQLVRPGMTVVDIGAHVGYYTVLFSNLVGSTGQVLAFEPHPVNFEILGKNVKRRGLKNVRLFQKAVLDTDRKTLLYCTPLSMGHSLSPEKCHRGHLEVEGVCLDTFLKWNGVKRVDFIKMDVEGYEPEVLEGMTNTVGDMSEMAIILEFKQEYLRARNLPPVSLLEKLYDMGFSISVIGRRARPVALDRAGLARTIGSIKKCNILAVKMT